MYCSYGMVNIQVICRVVNVQFNVNVHLGVLCICSIVQFLLQALLLVEFWDIIVHVLKWLFTVYEQ